MARDIKFRAWDEKGKRFVKGQDVTNRSIPTATTKEGFRLKTKFVLQQWTGLCDKNGLEIYEGDIVKLNPDNNMLRIVVWENGAYHLRVNGWQEKQNMPSHPLYFKAISVNAGVDDMPEVIGNVYQHPELLT